MFSSLKNIADYVTDPDFLGGVATGVIETTDKGEERRNKTLDQLRTYGLEKTNRLEQEYINDLDNNEEQVKLLAANLAPEGIPANSPEVLSAAQYLIKTKTLAGAQAESKRLYDQHKRFGISQLSEVGAEAANDGVNLTFRNIAGKLTRAPAPVNLINSGVPIKPTFLDRVFGGDTVEEEAQKSIANIQSIVPDLDVLPIIASTGYDADLIIRADMPVKDEIIRMKDKMKEAESANADDKKIQLIKNKIELLETAEIRERISGAKEFSPSESRTAKNTFTSDIGERYNLETKGDIIGGIAVMSFVEQTKNTILGMRISNRMTTDISDIRLSGNANVANELGKLNVAILTNRDYKIIEDPEYGIKSIELVDKKLFDDFDDDLDDDLDDDTTLFPSSGENEGGGNASAYLPDNSKLANKKSTGVTVNTPEVTAAVDVFKKLPPNIGGLKRNEARRAIKKAIQDANPGMTGIEAMKHAQVLLK